MQPLACANSPLPASPARAKPKRGAWQSEAQLLSQWLVCCTALKQTSQHSEVQAPISQTLPSSFPWKLILRQPKHSSLKPENKLQQHFMAIMCLWYGGEYFKGGDLQYNQYSLQLDLGVAKEQQKAFCAKADTGVPKGHNAHSYPQALSRVAHAKNQTDYNSKAAEMATTKGLTNIPSLPFAFTITATVSRASSISVT